MFIYDFIFQASINNNIDDEEDEYFNMINEIQKDDKKKKIIDKHDNKKDKPIKFIIIDFLFIYI